MTGELPPLFELPAEEKTERSLEFPTPELAQARISAVLAGACERDVTKGMAWYFDRNYVTFLFRNALYYRMPRLGSMC